MPSIGKAGVPPKYANKLHEHMLVEAHLIMESPGVPVHEFVKPLLT